MPLGKEIAFEQRLKIKAAAVGGGSGREKSGATYPAGSRTGSIDSSSGDNGIDPSNLLNLSIGAVM